MSRSNIQPAACASAAVLPHGLSIFGMDGLTRFMPIATPPAGADDRIGGCADMAEE